MSTPAIANAAEPQAPLSEMQRVLNVFVAPSKTFADIKRNANWIVPLLLLVILSAGYAYSIGQKVTWETASENQMKLATPAQQERIANMPADQRQKQMQVSAAITKGISYGFPVLAVIFTAIFAGLYLLVMNFGFGGEIKYKHLFAAMMYAGLVRGVLTLLAIIGIWTFIDPADFNVQMPLATSPAAFFNPAEHPFLFRLGASFDIFQVWATVLIGIALSVLSGKKRSTCLGVAFGVLIAVALLFSLPSLMM